jgi:hypothetical protein
MSAARITPPATPTAVVTEDPSAATGTSLAITHRLSFEEALRVLQSERKMSSKTLYRRLQAGLRGGYKDAHGHWEVDLDEVRDALRPRRIASDAEVIAALRREAKNSPVLAGIDWSGIG